MASYPLPRGSEDATLDTGFLSGSAGAAYMFLERYARDRDPADLATARGLLRWVNDQAVADRSGGLYWPISRGSAAMPAGFELGAAGIAWVNLRAYDATGDREYREVARRAAVWLRSVAIAGSAWAELPGDPTVPVHVGLDSGAAGIGWVLADLARAGLDPAANRAAARSALRVSAQPRPATARGRSGTPTGPGAGHGCAPSPRGTGAQPGSPASPPGSPDGPAAVRAGRVASDCCSRDQSRASSRTRLPPPEDAHGFDEPFRPLRPASRPKRIVALVLGPILWVVLLLVASWLLDHTNAIELGLLISTATFVFAAVVLSLLRLGRRREERRYAERA